MGGTTTPRQSLQVGEPAQRAASPIPPSNTVESIFAHRSDS